MWLLNNVRWGIGNGKNEVFLSFIMFRLKLRGVRVVS